MIKSKCHDLNRKNNKFTGKPVGAENRRIYGMIFFKNKNILMHYGADLPPAKLESRVVIIKIQPAINFYYLGQNVSHILI